MTYTKNKTYVDFFGTQQISSVYLRLTDVQEIIKLNVCLNIRKSPGVKYHPLKITPTLQPAMELNAKLRGY